MKRTAVFRFLRITAATICLLLCAASVSLWVSSYSLNYEVLLPIGSHSGIALTSHPAEPMPSAPHPARLSAAVLWNHRSVLEMSIGRAIFRAPADFWDHAAVLDYAIYPVGLGQLRGGSDFEFTLVRNAGFIATAPHWFAALIYGAIGLALVIPGSLRYSLRSLMVATAILAIVFGLIAVLRGW